MKMSSQRPFARFFGALLFALGSLSAQAQECDLNCHNNAPCVEGSADFSNHPKPGDEPLDFHNFTTSKNGYHCDCDPGWTGLRCARKFVSCHEDKHRCYHGGKCIEGLDEFGNGQYYCNCNNAEKDGVKYIGKYCEEPTEEVEEEHVAPNKITKCDSSGKYFCLNGMPCKDDYESTPNHPCMCHGSDFTGPHCEFRKGSVPDCTLQCRNGGTCALGIKSFLEAELVRGYDKFWNATIKAMHCKCPTGFYGPHCEIPATPCGEHHCFHGGKCVETQADDGTIKHNCDCTAATTAEKSYAGLYCQFPSTSFCQNPDSEDIGRQFCVNGGTCIDDGSSHYGCKCKPGYHGNICQYKTAITPKDHEDVQCKLQCENGGKCEKGVKNTALFKKYGIDLEHLAALTHNKDFEHCVCPKGFSGLKCDVKVQECTGSGDQICLHGSTCTTAGESERCDCNSAHNGFDLFAGIACQHKSTRICTEDGKPGLGKNKYAFCVNGGVCKGEADHSESHKGCSCPAGFLGDHCEHKEASLITAPAPAPSSGDGSSSSSSKTGAIVGTIVGVAVVGVIAAVLFMRRGGTSKTIDTGVAMQQPAAAATEAADGKSAPVLDMGPEKDIEGNELQNVEII